MGLTPSSRGEVKLKSGDVWSAPSINPNLLGSELDLYTAVEGTVIARYSSCGRPGLIRLPVLAVKKSREFMSADVFKGYIKEEYGPIAEAKTDEELAEFVRSYSSKHSSSG